MCALVTGVQACALPISGGPHFQAAMHTIAQRGAIFGRQGGDILLDALEPGLGAQGGRNLVEQPAHHGEAEVKRLPAQFRAGGAMRSEEHTSELQSLMRISYAVFCLKKKTNRAPTNYTY